MTTIVEIMINHLNDDEFKNFINHFYKYDKIMSQLQGNKEDYITLSNNNNIGLFNLYDDEETKENYTYGYEYGCNDRYYYDDSYDTYDDNEKLYGDFDNWESYYDSVYN